MKSKFVISIDFGGTKYLTAAISKKEGIIGRVKFATKVGKRKTSIAESLNASIEDLLDQTALDMDDITAVAVGIPGSVNPSTGIIGLAPNLGIKKYNLKKELQEFLPVPVLIENDVNLGALGIHRYGIAKKKKNVLVVFIGTGIGGGLIINNEIYRGSSFVAGEIGHMPVVQDGPLCGCGNRGCFEAVASRTAIVRNIISDIKAGKRSVLSKLVKNKTLIKSKSLRYAVDQEDKVTLRHLVAAGVEIGRVLAGINNLLNLDMIVLGGGVMEAMRHHLMPIIRESFKMNSLKDSAAPTKVVVSKLLDDAAIYGGLVLADEFLTD